MPWIIYRYIALELLKLLLVTTTILILVISLVAAIKPLSDGLLQPLSVLKFVLYFAPTMLAFALPFAAAFASTLVYLRMASDNEILACSSSGMSYRSLLVPPLVIGLVLTMLLFFLSNLVLPHFYRAANLTIERDAVTILVNQLNENRPFEGFDDAVLYADAAERRQAPHLPDSPIQPSEWVALEGVAVGQLDAEGRLRRDVTAEQANILLFRDGGQAWVTLWLGNVMYYDPVRGDLGWSPDTEFLPFQLPNPLRDNPKFFSWPELRRLEREPERYDRVREVKNELAREIGAERLRQLMLGQLRQGQAELTGAGRDDRYLIQAPQVEVVDGQLIVTGEAEQERPVRVQYVSPGGIRREFHARQATLQVEHLDADAEPNLLVQLEDVRVFAPGQSDRSTEQSERNLPRLLWPEPVLPRSPEELSTRELVHLVSNAPLYRDSPQINRALDQLVLNIQILARRIVGQVHDRAATALSCLLLIMLGAVLSMNLKHQTPLVVYFWSFVLAIVTILLIYAGERTARDENLPIYVGLGVLWAGNLLLAAATGWTYCRLARN